MKNMKRNICIFTLLMVTSFVFTKEYKIIKVSYDKDLNAYRAIYTLSTNNNTGLIIRDKDFSIVRDKKVLTNVLSISNAGKVILKRSVIFIKPIKIYNSGTSFYTAIDYMSKKQFNLALKNFRKAQIQDPVVNLNTDIYYRIAICYYKIGKIKKAIESMKKFIKFSDNYTISYITNKKTETKYFIKLLNSAKLFIKSAEARKGYTFKDLIWPHKKETIVRLKLDRYMPSSVMKNTGFYTSKFYIMYENNTIHPGGAGGFGMFLSLGDSTDFFIKGSGTSSAENGEKIFFLNTGIKWQFYKSENYFLKMTLSPLLQYRFDQLIYQRYAQFGAQLAFSLHITPRLLIAGAYQQPLLRSYMGLGKDDIEYFSKGINYIELGYHLMDSNILQLYLSYNQERVIAFARVFYLDIGYDFTDKAILLRILDVNF